MSDSNQKTNELVQAWHFAKQQVEKYTQVLEQEKKILNIHSEALAEHLSPGDMKDGEVIGIWVSGEPFGLKGDVLVELRRTNGEYQLGIRKRKTQSHIGVGLSSEPVSPEVLYTEKDTHQHNPLV